jgi:hypothetical protein
LIIDRAAIEAEYSKKLSSLSYRIAALSTGSGVATGSNGNSAGEEGRGKAVVTRKLFSGVVLPQLLPMQRGRTTTTGSSSSFANNEELVSSDAAAVTTTRSDIYKTKSHTATHSQAKSSVDEHQQQQQSQDSGSAAASGEDEDGAAPLDDAARFFFGSYANVCERTAGRVLDYSYSLSQSQLVIGDIDSMLAYATSTLKDARMAFRKNR